MMKADPMDSIHLKEITSPEKTMMSPSKSPTVMRRFALFVDGMARAMILPFGPSLVFRLVHGTSQVHTGSSVPYYFALVVAIYIVGRWLGAIARLWVLHRNCRCVASGWNGSILFFCLRFGSIGWLVGGDSFLVGGSGELREYQGYLPKTSWRQMAPRTKIK
jgi:hypothetical protein